MLDSNNDFGLQPEELRPISQVFGHDHDAMLSTHFAHGTGVAQLTQFVLCQMLSGLRRPYVAVQGLDQVVLLCGRDIIPECPMPALRRTHTFCHGDIVWTRGALSDRHRLRRIRMQLGLNRKLEASNPTVLAATEGVVLNCTEYTRREDSEASWQAEDGEGGESTIAQSAAEIATGHQQSCRPWEDLLDQLFAGTSKLERSAFVELTKEVSIRRGEAFDEEDQKQLEEAFEGMDTDKVCVLCCIVLLYLLSVVMKDNSVDLQEFKIFFTELFNKEGSEDNNEKVKQVSRVCSLMLCLGV